MTEDLPTFGNPEGKNATITGVAKVDVEAYFHIAGHRNEVGVEVHESSVPMHPSVRTPSL